MRCLICKRKLNKNICPNCGIVYKNILFSTYFIFAIVLFIIWTISIILISTRSYYIRNIDYIFIIIFVILFTIAILSSIVISKIIYNKLIRKQKENMM